MWISDRIGCELKVLAKEATTAGLGIGFGGEEG
jgi:hypothetical protein